MQVQRSMSPLTALFLGLFGVVAVGIVSGAAVTVYALSVVDGKASNIIGFATGTMEGLPDLLRALPPTVGDLLNDRRAPEYAPNIDVQAALLADERTGVSRPVLTITNQGDDVVSMLAIRVAAVNAAGNPIRDWTQVAATPLAIEGEWRGPLFPHETRHIVVSSCRGPVASASLDNAITVTEIAELRLWNGEGTAPADVSRVSLD